MAAYISHEDERTAPTHGRRMIPLWRGIKRGFVFGYAFMFAIPLRTVEFEHNLPRWPYDGRLGSCTEVYRAACLSTSKFSTTKIPPGMKFWTSNGDRGEANVRVSSDLGGMFHPGKRLGSIGEEGEGEGRDNFEIQFFTTRITFALYPPRGRM